MPKSLSPGQPFPPVTVPRLGGGEITLGGTDAAQLIVVYRGQHCPKCRAYLGTLEGLRAGFAEDGITTIAVSADTQPEAERFLTEIGYAGDAGYGLTETQMQGLGLYISAPRNPPDADHIFPEPGLFFVEADGTLSLVDVSNAPFLRPDLRGVLDGIRFGREKGFPVRGRHGL